MCVLCKMKAHYKDREWDVQCAKGARVMILKPLKGRCEKHVIVLQFKSDEDAISHQRKEGYIWLRFRNYLYAAWEGDIVTAPYLEGLTFEEQELVLEYLESMGDLVHFEPESDLESADSGSTDRAQKSRDTLFTLLVIDAMLD